ncbi:hypothetical protein H8B02_25065 [Bradyrhizobium sp. Pear77]|uniref:hypothetical protein n=1 Tax=Bradyrhizobium altum TaxID=1571202 RepID=UPI001E4EE001|nr:hypothetical protein [Bradyrhizobium altum]MCC8956578.1 hypothetical protein [Bradyrhizobium altum]
MPHYRSLPLISNSNSVVAFGQVEVDILHDRTCGVDSIRRIVRADQNAQIRGLDIRNGSKYSAINADDAVSVRCIHAARFNLLCAAKKLIDRKQQI